MLSRRQLLEKTGSIDPECSRSKESKKDSTIAAVGLWAVALSQHVEAFGESADRQNDVQQVHTKAMTSAASQYVRCPPGPRDIKLCVACAPRGMDP
ncbi:hypothetical protein EYF80_036363 [Liparis tanakae]|uniref:Uncharacterized protein n=1 Tax=Liparis tanakae TaxID=230148 RepID=A0A4Z2GKT7_9TELE|nr:hypothetical protein EYF80_036363 [Liparis tanakae]